MGLLLTLLACTGAPAPEVPLVEEAAPAAPLTVLAASSLTEALGAVNTAWAAQGHPAAQLSFDATSKLAKQVERSSQPHWPPSPPCALAEPASPGGSDSRTALRQGGYRYRR